MVAPAQTMESCLRHITPTMQVTVPHPAPVIREAEPTVRRPRRSPYLWPAITSAICLVAFVVGAFAGHVIKTDPFTKTTPVAPRTARANEVVSASIAAEGARPRAPIAPATPPRSARRTARATPQPSSTSDLELAFRAELHP